MCTPAHPPPARGRLPAAPAADLDVSRGHLIVAIVSLRHEEVRGAGAELHGCRRRAACSCDWDSWQERHASGAVAAVLAPAPSQPLRAGRQTAARRGCCLLRVNRGTAHRRILGSCRLGGAALGPPLALRRLSGGTAGGWACASCAAAARCLHHLKRSSCVRATAPRGHAALALPAPVVAAERRARQRRPRRVGDPLPAGGPCVGVKHAHMSNPACKFPNECNHGPQAARSASVPGAGMGAQGAHGYGMARSLMIN